jgi:hypothetical protein
MILSAVILGVFAVAAFAAASVAGAPPVQDDQPPVTTDDYDHQWHAADYTITLDANDGSGSGVNATYYILNGGPVMDLAVDGQPMITVENASNSIEYWSVDNDGNEEMPHKMLNGIKLDKTSPEADAGDDLELPEVSAWMLNGLGSRDNLGIASYVWHIQNGSWTDVIEGGSAWYVFFYPGEYPVTLTVTDNADNVDTAEMLVVVYDSTYPELDIVPVMTVVVGEGAQFSAWGCTDNVGIISYYWDFGDGGESYEMNATHAFEETGKVFVHLYVADEAGNEAYGSILVEVVPADDGESVPLVLYLAGAGIVMVGVVLATAGYTLHKRRNR